MSAARPSGPGVWVALGVLVVAVVVGVLLAGRARSAGAFELESTEPSGYAALGELLEQRGVTVSAAPIGEVLDPSTGAAAVTAAAAVVARPELLSPEEPRR